jgi:hypothetical protein
MAEEGNIYLEAGYKNTYSDVRSLLKVKKYVEKTIFKFI